MILGTVIELLNVYAYSVVTAAVESKELKSVKIINLFYGRANILQRKEIHQILIVFIKHWMPIKQYL